MSESTEKEKQSINLKESQKTSEKIVSDSQSEHEQENLPQFSENYEVIAFLGKGGMGSVYKVRDKDLDKVLAIKVLQKEYNRDAAALKRFEQETESASKLSHPNLVTVYKHGRTKNDEPYLVMDYIEGSSLAKIIENDGPLKPERALPLFINVCEALEHAHANGVIHRDIKPTNIIVTKTDHGEEIAKIVDFGIAKVMDASTRETHDLTQTGEVFGSPHYMSPEQCLGLMLKEQSDIYSLGCSLYESLTGNPPFAGSNPIQLVVKHINEEVKPFEKDFKKSKKANQLENITLKCLGKEMSDRFENMAALKADLEKIRDGKAITNYHRLSKAKPTLTKKQMLAIMGVLIGSFCYVTMTNDYIGYEVSNKISGFIALTIFSAAFIALVSMGVDKLKAIWSGQKQARMWWTMLITLSAGLAGLVFLPPILVRCIYGYYTPSYLNFMEAYSYIFHSIFMISLVSAVLGWLCFRKLKEVSYKYIAVRHLSLAALIVIIPVFLIPQTISNFLYKSALQVDHVNPNLSIELREAASKLATDKLESLKSLANAQQRHKQGAASRKTLRRALLLAETDEEKANLHKLIANSYAVERENGKAMRELNEAVSLIKNTTLPENYKLILERASYYFDNGDYDNALTDLNTYIENTRGNNSAYEKIAKIYILRKQYDKALEKLDWSIKVYNFDLDKRFLRAILLDHLGKSDLAKRDYKAIASYYNYLLKDPGYVSRYLKDAIKIQYAHHRLGNKKEELFFFKHRKRDNDTTEKDDLIQSMGLQDSGITLNWGSGE